MQKAHKCGNPPINRPIFNILWKQNEKMETVCKASGQAFIVEEEACKKGEGLKYTAPNINVYVLIIYSLPFH